MSEPTRLLHWHESLKHSGDIRDKGLQFNIAKTVEDENNIDNSNVIWQSVEPTRSYDFTWSTDYAFNWSSTLPKDGGRINPEGEWKDCPLDKAFDIDENGAFKKSDSTAKDGWMMIGNVTFADSKSDGIHIVIGLKRYSSDSNYDPIYIDPKPLPPGSGALYRPTETVVWWLESKTTTGSVYSQTSGSIGKINYDVPSPFTNLYEHWTTYITETSQWANSDTQPPVDPKNVQMFDAEFYPVFRDVVFDHEIDQDHQHATEAYLNDCLNRYYVHSSFEFVLPNKAIVEIGHPHPTRRNPDVFNYLVSSAEIDQRINGCLRGAQSSHALPGDVKWELKRTVDHHHLKHDQTNGAVKQPAQQASNQVGSSEPVTPQARKLPASLNPRASSRASSIAVY